MASAAGDQDLHVSTLDEASVKHGGEEIANVQSNSNAESTDAASSLPHANSATESSTSGPPSSFFSGMRFSLFRGSSAQRNDTVTPTAAQKLGGFFKTHISELSHNPSVVTDRLKQLGHDLKKTVESNKLISEFNQAQKEFVREKQAHTGLHPLLKPENTEHWTRLMFSKYDVDTKSIPEHHFRYLRSLVDNLVLDEKSFLGRGPPEGSKFQFADLFPIINEQCCDWLDVAEKCLRQSDELREVRYRIVPKRITEEQFWRNYFYKVWLIKANYDRQREHDPEALEEECRLEARKIYAASPDKCSSTDSTVRMTDLQHAHDAAEKTEMESTGGESKTAEADSLFAVTKTDTPVRKVLVSGEDDDGEWEAEIEKELSGYDIVTAGKATNEKSHEHVSDVEDVV